MGPLIYGLMTFALLQVCTLQRQNGPESLSSSPEPVEQIIQATSHSIDEARDALAHPSNYPEHYSPTDGEEFDFIVVGAGSAGAVVANRLSEEHNWRILLLEAGGNPTKTSEVPALMGLLQNTDLDWQYRTDPEENNCLSSKGSSCPWPRGKVLGGSSTLNFMVYHRGNSRDYDRWEADGNTGWGYRDVLPYFKKSEDMRAEEVVNTPHFERYHGVGGPLKVESWPLDEVKPLAEAFGKGMHELGYHSNPDCNGQNHSGFVTFQGTLEDGRRCSMAKAFLTPAKERPNLKVSKHSFVFKILINEETKTAYGVEFLNSIGKSVTVFANKEIVLAAGALNSPQLLLLSGVGPRKDLEKLNIPVVKDLPVGDNLQDHPLMVGLVISLNYSKPAITPDSMFDFLMKRKSRFSGLGLVPKASFVSTVKGSDFSDIELILLDFNRNDTHLKQFMQMFNYKDEVIERILEINSNSFSVVVLPSLLRPFSRGSVKLKSKDPKQHPKLTAGYLSDQRDMDTFLRTYDIVSKWVQTKGLQSVGAKLHELQVPGCKEFVIGSREYRECSLRHLVTTTYHYSSTCKMGPASSPDSVVDPTLRVKGINSLRVIDTSIMPDEVSGHINAVAIMIGEKGADLIKNTWSEKIKIEPKLDKEKDRQEL